MFRHIRMTKVLPWLLCLALVGCDDTGDDGASSTDGYRSQGAARDAAVGSSEVGGDLAEAAVVEEPVSRPEMEEAKDAEAEAVGDATRDAGAVSTLGDTDDNDASRETQGEGDAGADGEAVPEDEGAHDGDPADAGVEAASDGGVVHERDADADADTPAPDGAVVDPATPSAGIWLTTAGVGVSDLEAASDFYLQNFELSVVGDYELSDRTVRLLTFASAGRGSNIALIQFKETRATQNLPGKLVFVTPELDELMAKLLSGGATLVFNPTEFEGSRVGMVTGYDGLTLELVEAETVPGTYLLATGIGVADLAAASAFYQQAFDMTVSTHYAFDDLTEDILSHGSGQGSGLVLMHWQSRTDYQDRAFWHTRSVPDLEGALLQLEAAGGSVVAPAAPSVMWAGARTALATDLDGNVLELVEQE